MARRVRPNFTPLALLTTASLLSASDGPRPLPISKDLLDSIRGQQPQRIAAIAHSLEAAKFDLRLGMLDGLEAFNQITDRYGNTLLRCRQTYRGVEVYNGIVLGRMDASGHMLATRATVQAGIDLAPVTLLPETKIRGIVTAGQPEGGRLLHVLIKPLVFPTQFQGGIQVKRDSHGGLAIDPYFSLGNHRKAEPYRWAFQASSLLSTVHGLVSTEFIVDGLTGEILKKWDGAQHAEGPVLGTGNSQYNGTVVLNTTQLADGTYSLCDTTRATMPHPLATRYPEWGTIGIQTFYNDDYGPNAWTSGTTPYVNASNTWGDGQAFVWANDTPASPRGETAAADAHYAIQCTWDYYKNVLGRTGGIDGQGGSPISIMHLAGYTGPWGNAAWDPSSFVMLYGDGGPTGALASLDVASHEMSHGVNTFTAGLQGWEGSGLNEANSDIHATMVRYYSWGSDGTGSQVPATTTRAPGGHNEAAYLWTIGAQLSSDGVTPLRWIYKPSKDGISYDAWFDGVGIDDSHYSMGPANRAFYFLCNGASSNTSEDAYSPFLPGGMAGIGNDKAIHIWYHAMTTFVANPDSSYHDIRKALLDSAAELYPGVGTASSPESAAVKNAFAAINVGAPEGGQDPVTVSFVDNPSSPFAYKKILVAPAQRPITLPPPTVANAMDTTVTYSLGGLSAAYAEGGRWENGQFVAPMVSFGSLWPIKATSKQDPRRYASTLVYGAPLDCDSDTDLDACDLGALALAYGGVNIDGYLVYPAANIYGGNYGCDAICLELFLEGFQNAFTH
jgi:Zn-dependent metalloprotease